MTTAQNLLAKSFKAFHQPGSPLILVNVYDAASGAAVASLPASKALATASYAIAQATGVEDDDLTLQANLAAAKAVAVAAKKFQKPLSVDFQDGYGNHLEQATRELLEIGAVGMNLEDWDKAAQQMYKATEATARIKRVLAVAKSCGVPDFVVNARCDALVHGGSLHETITRGQAYLEAGATTVFVWGGSARGGISRDEVIQLVEAFNGRLNVLLSFSSGSLTIEQLADIGVARISIGPSLQIAAMAKFKQDAERMLQI